MPTVIDSLIVELGLDVTQFTKAQKEAAAAIIKTRDEFEKRGKEIEAQGKKMAESISTLTNRFLTLFGVLLGGRSMVGFAENTVQASLALRSLSEQLGMAPTRVSQWQQTFERLGATQEQASESLAKLGDQIQRFKRGAGDPQFVQLMGLLGLNPNPFAYKTGEDVLNAIQRALVKATPQQLQTVEERARALGIPQQAITAMRQPDWAKTFADTLKTAFSQENIDNAAQLNKAFVTLMQTMQALARFILDKLAGPITDLVNNLTKQMENHEFGKIALEIGGALLAFRTITRMATRFLFGTFLGGGTAPAAGAAEGGLGALVSRLFWPQMLRLGALFGPFAAMGAMVGDKDHSKRQGLRGFIDGIFGTHWADQNEPAPWEKGGQWRNADAFRGAGVTASAHRTIREGRTKDDLYVPPRDIKAEVEDPVRKGVLAALRDWSSGGGGGIDGDGTGPGGRNMGGFAGGLRRGHGGRAGAAGIEAGGGSTPGSTADAMKYAMAQLREEGVPEANLRAAAAHLVGQAISESGLRPGAVHDGGIGYGIYGANDTRLTAMRAWMKARGYPQNSLEGQQRFMAHEAMTNPRFAATRHILMRADESSINPGTVNEVTGNFEGPKVINSRIGNVRAAYKHAGPQSSLWLDDFNKRAPAGVLGLASASRLAAIHNPRLSTTTASNEVNIGQMAIHTQAQNADDLAQDLQPSFKRFLLAGSSNYSHV